jgi:DNA-binding cell septation regulator SpoVG
MSETQTVTPTLDIKVVRINKTSKGKLRGFVDLKVNDVITLKGFKIFEGNDGLFVSPPSHKAKTGDKWYPDVFIEGDDYVNIQNVVLAKYNA